LWEDSAQTLRQSSLERRKAADMQLSDHDLRQLDEAYLELLSEAQARALLSKALADLKTARERLGQNPTNSSRPPSTRTPWEQAGEHEQETGREAPTAPSGDEQSDTAGGEEDSSAQKRRGKSRESFSEPGKPGRRKGAPGHSRTQQLPIDAEVPHVPACCAGCAAALDDSHQSRAHNARYELELTRPGADGNGLVVQQTKHVYFERRCDCGHWTRAEPGRCDDEGDWTVALSEWHLAGPTLVSFICALSLRMRLSRARVRELLSDWLGLSLSTATINQCVHEAARALEPVVEQEILETVRNVELLYADETAWKEHGKLLWLWVFTCTTATFFIVGRRTRAMVHRVLGEHFDNWLMSDGYAVYRDFDQRLRCLAHIIRKAHGLEDGFDPSGQRFGTRVLNVIETIIEGVYAARGGAPPAPDLRAHYAPVLDQLFAACRRMADSGHEPTRKLARELLNDWDTFWVVLDYPEFPLTNNEAERALRHWVIARRIGMGTRTPQGSRAFALLASVIETCRKRSASPWTYLADVVRQRRKGLPAPALPVAA
jgi:transposase